MEKQLKELNVTYTIDFIGYDSPKWDKHHHRHYKVTFTKGKQSYTFDYWDSVNSSYLIRFDWESSFKKHPCTNYRIKGIKDNKASDDYPIKLGPVAVGKLFGSEWQRAILVKNPSLPDIADILGCCELSEPPLSFDDFCAEFGYSNDSINALETHRTVLEQYAGLRKVFGEEGLQRVWETIND